MALRRTLSLRSLFTARCYQPSYSSIIRPHREKKPNGPSFLHQRPFSSSVLSQHLGRRCSHLSPRAPFGVAISRSMSTSHVPSSDDTGNVNHSAVMENVAPQVLSDSSIHSDLVQWLIETVHSFTGLEMWASIVLTTVLIRGATIPLMINQARGWSRTMKLGIHSTACEEIVKQGGDPAALARHKIEFDKLAKEYGGTVFLSPFLPFLQLPALMCMGLTKVALTELTVFSPSFIFPLLTGLTFWITVEYDAIVGFEDSFIIFRKYNRFMVIPVVVAGLILSKEVHCYLMSCMLFSIAFMHVIRRPGVKKHLGIPEVTHEDGFNDSQDDI